MTALDHLVFAVQDGDEEQAATAARQTIGEGLPVTTVIDSLTAGLRAIGDRFARQEIFLPEMLLAARAMQAAMTELEPEIAKQPAPSQRKAVVVIGTVEGDMHEIGKDIAITLLKVAGFDVHDLGANVNALDFVRKAEEVHADVIGASALMTTTTPNQKEIVDILLAKGLRSKYHVILGGAPVTKEWVAEAGADSWGENAASAVKILERMMAERSK
jgi:corrinoid protein of di/trimethylamine methyltransferase